MSVSQSIDLGKLTDALVAADIGPGAREEASRLVEGWLGRLDTFPEVGWRVRFVETPFYISLAHKVYVVGQMDAGFSDKEGIIFGEWKSRRAPKLKKDGTNYAGDDKAGWLEEISNGPQLGAYALAGREGYFISPVDNDVQKCGFGCKVHTRSWKVDEPRILVRAAVKSTPVDIWEGMFKFEGALLDTVKASLLSEAAAIRARRQLGSVPFAIPGIHCTNMYHRKCEHYDTVCQKRLTPPMEPVGFHPTDPGFVVAELLGLDPHDRELVVISASALDDWRWCPERGRINYDGHAPREEDFNLDTGTGLHKGLAEIYRQLGGINGDV
jgi:hypothetical protein